MELRQLFDPESSTCSYLLWDRESRAAAMIDPVEDQVERDVQLIRKLGLKLCYTLETHVHADHITSSGILRNRLDAIIMVHEDSQAKCADVLLRDGDQLPLGNSRIEVLSTPGHTDTDVSFMIPGAVLTGDALLIRGCGRTDFQSGDAGTLFDSITQRLFALPDSTIVYPGHDYHGHTCSTIAEEKLYNPRIGSGKTREEFISIMDKLELDPPARMHEALPSNLRCGNHDCYSNRPGALH